MKTVIYIDNTSDYYGTSLFRGFTQESKKHKWWQTLIFPQHDINDSSLDELLKQGDAFVTRGVGSEILDLISNLNKPHLFLRSASTTTETTAPHVNDYAIGRLASEEIINISASHQAFLGFEDVIWSESRRKAFKKYIPKSGELLIQKELLSSTDGLKTLLKWLMEQPKPTAIFAASDDLAVAAVQACVLAKIRVPQEISIIGTDNNPHLCDNSVITISSIDQHPQRIGRKIAWALAHQMDLIKDLSDEPLFRPPELVIRESSHLVSKNFIIYKSALSWINSRALAGPSVNELAEACGVSRRSIERIFHNVAKTSPASVIRKKRINAILHLLIRDSIPMSQLAQQARFPDQSSFSNFVHRNMGATPSHIRSNKESYM